MNTNSPFDVQAHIARLFVYPLKSCAGVELRTALLTETGLDLDRAWMVVDAQGVFVSQRQLPRMALIQPQIKTDEIVLRAPGMLALHLRIDTVESAATARVWDDEVKAYDMGDIAAQWLSDFLAPATTGAARSALPYRLVRFDPEQRRLSSMQWTGGVEAPNQFADGFPLLIVSAASLEGLNQRLLGQGHGAVTIERLRPNIVLGGVDAHDEDRIDAFRIACDDAEVRLNPVKPCARCTIPNIDPLTALSNPQVGDTLQTYRRDARVGGGVTFGMNAIIASGVDQVLRVGQRVRGNYLFGQEHAA